MKKFNFRNQNGFTKSTINNHQSCILHSALGTKTLHSAFSILNSCKVLFLLAVAIMVTGNVWGSDHYYSRARGYVSTSGMGSIYVAKDAQTYSEISDWQSSSDQTSSNKDDQNPTYYYYAKPNTGYEFKGWSESSNGTIISGSTNQEDWHPSFTISKNTSTYWINRYAVFAALKYTVNLDQQSGTGGTSSVTATYNSDMPSATMPKRTGYTFGGYYDGTNGSGTQYYTATGASARKWDKAQGSTLYAKWTINSWTLTLNGLDGATYVSGTKAGTYNYGTALTQAVYSKTGYNFAWDASWPSTMPDEAVTRTAVWTAKKYNLNIDYSGGNKDGATSYSVSKTASTSLQYKSGNFNGLSWTRPSRTGYNFLGFYAGSSQVYNSEGACTNEGTYWSGSVYVRDGDMSLTTGWQAKTYPITLNGNGGNAGSATATYDGSWSGITHCTRTGYTLNGYYTATSGGTMVADASGKLQASVSGYTDADKKWKKDSDGTITLYAQWTPITYSISFSGNGSTSGGPMSNLSMTYDVSKALTANVFSRTGYTYDGWATSASGAKVYKNQQSVSNLSSTQGATVPLYAHWVANKYTVTFDANQGTFGSSTTTTVQQTYNSNYVLPSSNPTRTGYTFKGWYTATSGGTQVTTSTTFATANNDTKIYAQWTANTYYGRAVVYHDPLISGGGAVTVGGYKPSDKDGWKYFHQQADSSSSNKTYTTDYPYLTAKYFAQVFTGYHFVGWYDENGVKKNTSDPTETYNDTVYHVYTENFQIRGTSSGNPTRLVRTAKFAPNNYNVTFDANQGTFGSSTTTTVQQTYNTNYKLPSSNPTRAGYNFTGWFTAASGGTQVTTSTTFATANDDTKLYAQWSPASYTVTLNDNGGSGGSGSVTATYDAAMPAATAPTRGGFSFQGYFDTQSQTGGTKYYNADMTSAHIWNKTGNTTLYARWLGYTITFNANGGSGTMENHNTGLTESYTLPANGFTAPASHTITYNTDGGNTISPSVITNLTFNGWEDHGSIIDKYNNTWTYEQFDGPFYANKYSDLYNAFGYNKLKLVNHYSEYTYHGSETRICLGYNRGVYPVGGAVSQLSTETGTTVPLYAQWKGTLTLPTPTKADNAFKGWYDGETFIGNGGDSFTFTRSTTLTAHWTPSYQVHYDGNGATSGSIADALFDFDVAYTLPSTGLSRQHTVTYTGLGTWTAQTDNVSATFQGWEDCGQYKHTNKDGSTTIFCAVPGSGVDSLFDAPPYGTKNGGDVRRSSLYGNGVYDKDLLYQHYLDNGVKEYWVEKKEFRCPYVAGDPGYYPILTTEGDSSRVRNMTNIPGHVVTLKAHWKLPVIKSLPMATRTGYQFNGWSDGTKVHKDSFVVSKTIQLTSDWTANTYYVVFKGNGATSDTTATQTFTYDKSQNLTANGFHRAYTVSYNGNGGSSPDAQTATYTFKNWNTNSGGTGTTYTNNQSVTNLTTTDKATITMYAQWNSASFTLPSSTRTGYTFAGWKNEAGTILAAGASYTPSKNETLTAQWNVHTYTVVFNGNGNTGGSTPNQGFTYDAAQNLTANGFTKTYTITYTTPAGSVSPTSQNVNASFSGWAESAEGSVKYTNQQSVSNLTSTDKGTVNLYAKWGNAATQVTLPTPENGGQHFLGWYNGSTRVGGAGESYTAPGTITLTAHWEKYTPSITGTATYNLSVSGEQTADYSSTHTSTVNPSSDPNADYYYTIDHSGISSITTGSPRPTEIISYDPATKKIVALNAGTAKITFHQKATYALNAAEKTFTIVVTKHEPTFTWGSATLSTNQKVTDYFSTNNTDCAITYSSSGTATLCAGSTNHKLNVQAEGDAGSASLTVNQAENYYWAYKTDTKNVTTTKPSNHLEMYIDSETKYNNYVSNIQSMKWEDGIVFKSKSLGSGGDVRWVEFAFTGIPDKLTGKLSTDAGTTTPHWEWKQLVNGNWETLNTQDTKSDIYVDEQLNPLATAVRFEYSKPLNEGYLDLLRVTELVYFRRQNNETSTLNFGTNQKDHKPAVQSFTVEHCNAGYVTTITAPDHYLVSLSQNGTYTKTINYSTVSDPQTGGDKMGSFVVWVQYQADATDASGDAATHNGNVVVSNNLRDPINVPVTGTTEGLLTTTATWTGATSYNKIAEIANAFEVRDKNQNIVSGTWSNLQSTNSDAIKISGGKIVPVCGGSATITGDFTPSDQSKYKTCQGSVNLTIVRAANPITWKEDASGEIHYWADNANWVTGLASCQTAITYSADKSDILMFNDDHTAFYTKKAGTVTLTATTSGDCGWDANSSTHTIYVDPCKHSIVWDQTFLNYTATSGGVIDVYTDLTAYAVDSQRVETHVAITYSVADESIAKIVNGNRLHVIGVGETTITATTVADDKYAIATTTRTIKVRKEGDKCTSTVLTKGSLTYHTGQSDQFPLSGPVHTITFKYSRNTYLASGGTILQINLLDENKTNIGQIFNKDYSAMSTSEEDFSKDISSYTTAKYLEIQCISGKYESNEVYISNLSITQNSYFRDDVSTISDVVYVNTEYNRNITISYSDVPVVQYSITDNSHSGIKFEPNEIPDNDCGDYGTYVFTLSGTWNKTTTITETISFWTSANEKINIPFTLQVNPGPLYKFNVNNGNWEDLSMWTVGGVTPVVLPNASNEVNVTNQLTINSQVECYSLEVGNNGSITIAPNGGLSVGAGGLTGLTQDNFRIQSSTSNQGYFRMSPDAKNPDKLSEPCPMPSATVEFATKATLDNGANKDATWQYFGIPVATETIDVDYITWFYRWSEPYGWTGGGNNVGPVNMEAWNGYCVTQYGQPTYEWKGQLLNGSQTCNLTVGGAMNGDNMVANSFASPIDVKKFTEDDFSGQKIDATFYVFNAGSWKNWKEQTDSGSTFVNKDVPGSFRAIAILSAKYEDGTIDPTLIAPMQGICIHAKESGAWVKFDYAKHVWPATSDDATKMTDAIRAPQRIRKVDDSIVVVPDTIVAEQDTLQRRVRLQVYAPNSGVDHLYLMQKPEFTMGYDNGYDAPKMLTNGLLNIYTHEDEANMAVSARNKIDSTYIGMIAGEDNVYQLTITSVIGDSMLLKDMSNGVEIPVVSGQTYTFNMDALAQDNQRFLLHKIAEPKEKPDTPTQLGEEASEAYIWVDANYVHIENATANSLVGLFASDGKLVVNETINRRADISIDHLVTGMYLVYVDGKPFKFIKR